MTLQMWKRALTRRATTPATVESGLPAGCSDTNPYSCRRLIGWTVWALACAVAMFLVPDAQTIPYHLGWAAFALAFGLGTWSKWQLVSALTWYTIATGAAIANSFRLGTIGFDETTEIPLMFLLAMLMVWHVRRRQTALAIVTKLAAIDSLTGLANRSTFNTALESALQDESSPNTTVLFIDLDDFKGVNDVFGHRAGDDLLREVGARLLRATRPGDLCARLGGDEFAVMLRGTSSGAADAAADLTERLVAALAATVPSPGMVVRPRGRCDVRKPRTPRSRPGLSGGERGQVHR